MRRRVPPRRWPGGLVRRLLLCLGLLLLVSAPGGVAHASAERDLQEAGRAYERSDFQRTIALLRPLLYPRHLLPSQEQVIQAYRLLAISYIFEKKRDLAEKQLLAILALRPDYRLDPLVDPVAAVELLEEVKKRNAEKIKAILDRERREGERRRIEELRRQEAERRRALQAARPHQILERSVIKNRYWINYVPFGAGQFQNGHRRKGLVLLGTQVGLGALSLGTALGLRLAHPHGLPRGDDAALALAVTQVVSGALCLAVVAYGIIDALVYYQPEVVHQRRYEEKKNVRLLPSLGPGQVGLDLGVSF